MKSSISRTTSSSHYDGLRTLRISVALDAAETTEDGYAMDEFAWKAQELEISVGIFSYAGLKGACILYSALLRDLLMKLAKAELWLDRQTTAMICRFVKSSRTAGTLRAAGGAI